jgi:acyl-CoA reductase-like NAD-dependent aldehyde dehydrogenase
MKALLEKLQIKAVNQGVCAGAELWIEDSNGEELVSYNPATGEAIAAVLQATPQSYNVVVKEAH